MSTTVPSTTDTTVPLQSCPPASSLVPIRINATSANGCVRVVDTMILDPKCLPHPLTFSGFSSNNKNNNSKRDCIQSCVLENAKIFADILLSDLEVIGMTRTSRHYINRTNLFMDLPTESPLGKWKNPNEEEEEEGADGFGNEEEDEDEEGEGEDVGGIRTLRRSVEEQIYRQLLPAVRNAAIPPSSSSKSGGSDSSLKTIKIRLRQNDIVVMDEFQYDIHMADPMALAESIVQDLNLPWDMTPSIVTSIVEQIYNDDACTLVNHSDMPLEIVPRSVQSSLSSSSKVFNKEEFMNMTSSLAWMAEPKETAEHTASIAQQHRPKSSSRSRKKQQLLIKRKRSNDEEMTA